MNGKLVFIGALGGGAAPWLRPWRCPSIIRHCRGPAGHARRRGPSVWHAPLGALLDDMS
jgi:antirestriction protein ArdC